jgi:hypothetical protein
MITKYWLILKTILLLAMCGACGGTVPGTQAAATPVSGEAGRLLWVALQCSEYAKMSGKAEQEVERLFRLGYENGQRFIEGVGDHTIAEAEVRSKVPMGVTAALAGPTTEFMLGRVYESATTDAYDRVVKRGDFGLDLPASEWRTETEVKKMWALNEYNDGNCGLVR